MTIFNVLSLIGGLSLFLFGMEIMGQSLERRAGSKLRNLLETLTKNKFAGFLTGIGVTAIIQSSSATTVMVVGFVNSGLMNLKQAIGVIMGANIGTTITAWVLSLAGIDSSNTIVQLFKPSSFTPILALIGIIFYMTGKSDKKKDTGAILLGFVTLMFGMEAMSGAMSGLRDVPEFQQLFIAFQNPVLGVLAGALLTAIIQSSSASVGILQALSQTGQVTFGAAIPIIMGQNIGTCVTALLSGIGANKNAKRVAIVHLLFNVIGAAVLLAVYSLVKALFAPAMLSEPATMMGIAVAHSAFNIICTAILMPFSGKLEKLACRIIPDGDEEQEETLLDERLLVTPSLALENCKSVTKSMALASEKALKKSFACINEYDANAAKSIRKIEKQTDKYEDELGSYLVKLSSNQREEQDSAESAMILKVIGDFERLGDHAVNLVEAAEELNDRGIKLSAQGAGELSIMINAVEEILQLAVKAYNDNDMEMAYRVEPLEEVIDGLKETIRTKHIKRLQKGSCTIDAGFVLSDILTNLERVSDHCSNIAGSVIDLARSDMNMHENLRGMREENGAFAELYNEYEKKYAV